MGSKIILILILFISCTNDDEDMKFFIPFLRGNPAPLTVLKIKLTEGDQANTYVSSILNGKELQQRVEAFNGFDNLTPNVLDYSEVYLDGIKIKEGGEDAAPYRIMGTTIGANHGYYKSYCTSVGHGKADVDIGSQWTSSAGSHTIWAINGADNIWVDGPDPTGLTLTHVSGATNTASFTVASRSNRQFYPVTKNYSLVMKVDGVVTPIATSEVEAVSDIVFEESYDIMTNSSILAYIQANAGTLSSNTELDGTSVVTVTNKIRYTRLGNTLETDFLVLPGGDGLAFQDIMFVMGFQLTESATYPNLKAYIPKALPYTDTAGTWDWANIQDVSGVFPIAARSNITPSNAIATGIFADRHLYLLDGLGFSMGYLPIDDADPSIRRTRANNKALQIAESGKIYMSAIDDNGQSVMNNGDYFKVTSYKTFFERSGSRTAYYIVDANNGDYYLYADWHGLPAVDSLKIPSALINKPITLIEKSANVSYTGMVLGSILHVTITNDLTCGYLILKL